MKNGAGIRGRKLILGKVSNVHLGFPEAGFGGEASLPLR